MLTGRLALVSPQLLTVTTGKTSTQVSITTKTRWWRSRTPSQPEAFQQNQLVVVHVRHLRSHPTPVAVEVADAASWRWLVIIRKTAMDLTIAHIGSTTLTTVPTTTMPAITYEITPRTKWGNDGNEVPANPFVAGDKVWILPRSSAALGVAVRAVADTRQMLMILKERLAPVIHGRVIAVGALPRSFEVSTVAGDKRTLVCSSNLLVLNGKRTETWNVLRVGMQVVARLHRDELGKRVVWKITIDARHRYKR